MSKRLSPAKPICMRLAKNGLAGKQPPRSPAQGPTPWGYARTLLWGPRAPRWGLPRPPTLYPDQPTLHPGPKYRPGLAHPIPQPAYPAPPAKPAPARPPYTLPRYCIVNQPSTLFILHMTFLILFPYMPLDPTTNSIRPSCSPAKVANRFPSNKGSSKQPSPLIYHVQPPHP